MLLSAVAVQAAEQIPQIVGDLTGTTSVAGTTVTTDSQRIYVHSGTLQSEWTWLVDNNQNIREYVGSQSIDLSGAWIKVQGTTISYSSGQFVQHGAWFNANNVHFTTSGFWVLTGKTEDNTRRSFYVKDSIILRDSWFVGVGDEEQYETRAPPMFGKVFAGSNLLSSIKPIVAEPYTWHYIDSGSLTAMAWVKNFASDVQGSWAWFDGTFNTDGFWMTRFADHTQTSRVWYYVSGDVTISDSWFTTVSGDQNGGDNGTTIPYTTPTVSRQVGEVRIVQNSGLNLNVIDFNDYFATEDGRSITFELSADPRPTLVQCTIVLSSLSCEVIGENEIGTVMYTVTARNGEYTVTQTFNLVVARSSLILESNSYDVGRITVPTFRILDGRSNQHELEAYVVLENTGDTHLNNVRVQLFIPELGLRAIQRGPFTLSRGERQAFNLRIETHGHIEPGYYLARLSISNDEGAQRILHREVYITT